MGDRGLFDDILRLGSDVRAWRGGPDATYQAATRPFPDAPMTQAPHSILDHAGLDRGKATALVADALNGADDGELYLEHRSREGLVFDNGRLKSASFDTSQGFGLRAVAGEAAGYAHSGEISEPAIRRACGRGAGGQARPHRHLCRGAAAAPTASSTATRTRSMRRAFADKVKLLEAIDAYARAEDPRVRQVTASLAGSRKRVEILRADGKLVRDVRPLVRLNVSVVVGDGDRQETGSYGMGGREGFEQFVDRRVTGTSAVDEALRQALVNLDAVPAPAGDHRRGARPGLARHPAARGGRPWPRGRLQPQEGQRLRRADGPARRLARRDRGR